MVTSFLWGPVPVFALTIRQFFGGKAVRVVGLLGLLPAVFALIYAINPDMEDAQFFLSENIFRGLFVATLLPILVLILATGAIGNEIEDQTLPYLTLKPITRLRIVIEKLVAVVVTATPLVFAGLLLGYLLVFRGDSGDSENLNILASMLGSTFAGVVAYGSLFMLVSLLINRALLAGIVYALVWESLLGRYLPGLKLVSVRHYTESIYVGLLDAVTWARLEDPDNEFDDPTRLPIAILVIVGICVVSVLLSAWRLRNLNLE